MEVPSSDCSATAPAFTRNPRDRYLTPVPPKPLVSARLGDLCIEPYKVPMHTHDALHGKHVRLPAPKQNRRMRSVSTSTHAPFNPTFSDLKDAKDRAATRVRSSSDSRAHKGTYDARNLKISAPVLISSTAEDMTLVPLQSIVSQTTPSKQAHIANRMREFSPLWSHPVDKKDVAFGKYLEARRPRSHTPAVATPLLKASPGRVRANSADTRRMKGYYNFANEPWITSPRLPPSSVRKINPRQALEQRNRTALAPPSMDISGRPMSRRGGDMKADIWSAPIEKDLPELPRDLVPAPLFACTSMANPTVTEERSKDSSLASTEANTCAPDDVRSHKSSSSIASSISGSPTSDQSQLHSPTFSSFTSGFSQAELSPRHSNQCPTGDQKAKRKSATEPDDLDQDSGADSDASSTPSANPRA